MFTFVPLSLRTQALSSLDSKSVGQIIQSYAQKKQPNRAKELHALLLRSRHPLCTFVINHLINMYCKCGLVEYAHNMFDKMSQRNMVSWTSMITGFSQNLRLSEAVKAFSLMRLTGVSPTQFAFASIVKACVSLSSVETGKQVHCLVLKHGLDWDVFTGSNLADMYSKCGMIVDARKLFEEVPCKDSVMWTAMIDGYGKNGEFEAALVVFKRMNGDGIVLDPPVLSSTLSACATLKALMFGKCLHSSVVKLGFESELVVSNALLDMYLKSGDMESASIVFMILSERRNVVSFTSMIRGFGEKDQIDEALAVFVDLRRQGIDPNEYTFSSLIKACAKRASLKQGTQIHAQVVKLNFNAEPYIASGLLDMYGKCGLLYHSTRVFDEIRNPTEIAWNSLLSVFVQHGLGKEAVGMFEKMVLGVRPDAVTFKSLLLGCSCAGLVEEGLNYFRSMEEKYGVVPREEHYNCVLDLLSRAGRLNEAEEFINSLPFEPNAYGWSSLLRACRVHGDAERGKFAAEKLNKLEPENAEALGFLLSVYEKARKWKEVKSLRARMRKGKFPGHR